MNFILFYCSTILGLCQCLYIFQILSHHIYFYSVLLGVITSILNHGFNHYLLQYIDRIVMYFLFCYNLYLCCRYWLLHCLFYLLNAVVLYILAKRTKNSKWHVLSHICVSINNIFVSNYFFDRLFETTKVILNNLATNSC